MEQEMDVIQILDNIRQYINSNSIKLFKLGFVGNGEPLLEFELLKSYIEHIADLLESSTVSAYVITNGLLLDREKLEFFGRHNIQVGISIDGLQWIHDKWRNHSFAKVRDAIGLYKEINGCYPSMNCTVGRDILEHAEETIQFFAQFKSRITFSRMIGKYGISLDEFRCFLDKASGHLHVRRGGYDCTMYGGMCGAGIDNLFYANGKIFICGNCVDMESPFSSDTPLDKVSFGVPKFDRQYCYKESVLKK